MSKAAVLTVTLLAGVLLLVGAGGTKTANDKRVTNSFVFHFKKQKEVDPNDCNKWRIVKGIRYYRATTWTYNWQAGSGLTRFSKWRPKHSCDFLTYLAVSARKKANAARHAFEIWFNRTYAKWNCIHNHEASWYGDNNPKYDGGLQMDDSFEESYGSDFIRLWGHNASNWPVWAQLRAAERAYASRGFYPWPTRAYC